MFQLQKVRYTSNDNPNKYIISRTICRKVLKSQRNLCNDHFRLIPSVVTGFALAINECQYQFSNHMWNCKGHNMTAELQSFNGLSYNRKRQQRATIKKWRKRRRKRKNRDTYLDRLIGKSRKESAYLLSVISAGVSHQVTKACSQGIHSHCGCDRTKYKPFKKSNYKWSGCSDNIHFGVAFTRRFLDAREKKRFGKKPEIALTNMHNNNVGRQAVIKNMKVKCKCHGVSGSCEIKTCSRNLPSFREIGDILKKIYKDIVKVDLIDNGLIPVFSTKHDIGEHDMIYLRDSPDHCNHDPHKGTLGTYGRICNTTGHSTAEDSCYNLCCRRGYSIVEFMKNENCRCTFIWCCKVVCDTCQRKVVNAICN